MTLASAIFFVNLFFQILHVMKTKILYLYFVLSCSPAIVFSQTEEKNYTKAESISTKVVAENPLLHNARENALIGSEKTNVNWSLKPLSIGTYTSGDILRNDYPWLKAYGVSLALFPASLSSYQYNSLSDIIPYEINTAKHNDFRGSDITTFWDPGITVFSPNRKFSVDLYKKSSTQIFFSSPGKANPLLLNLHFWKNPFSVLLHSDKADKLFLNFSWLWHYHNITLFT